MRDQRKAQGRVNLSLVAHLRDGLRVGRQAWMKQFRAGFPIVGSKEEPGVFRTHACPDPDLSPEQLLSGAEWSLKARQGNITGPMKGFYGKNRWNMPRKGG